MMREYLMYRNAFSRIYSQEIEMPFISLKNIVLNTHLRYRRAGFSLQPPMLHESCTEEGPISFPVEV